MIIGTGSAVVNLLITVTIGLFVGSLIMLVEVVLCMLSTFSILCSGLRLVLIISLVNHCFGALAVTIW